MPLPTYQPRRKGVAPTFESHFTSEIGAEVCRRVAAGMSVVKVCREPGMPCTSTIYRWTIIYPDFKRELVAAQRVARRAKAQAQRARWAEADAAKRWRWTRRAWNYGYSRELASEICYRLVLGESLVGICRDPHMPQARAVYSWLREHEDFAELYSHARGAQRDGLEDEVTAIFNRLTRATRRREKRWFKHLRRQIGILAPKGWDIEDRRDLG